MHHLVLQSVQGESNSLLKHTAALLKVGALGMRLGQQGFYLRQLRQQGVSAGIQLAIASPTTFSRPSIPSTFRSAHTAWGEDWARGHTSHLLPWKLTGDNAMQAWFAMATDARLAYAKYCISLWQVC